MTYDVDALIAARGAVRDGSAAIANLGHLLSSRRVASRAIATALPDVEAGFGALRGALDRLGSSMVGFLEEVEAKEAATKMIARADASVVELQRELEARGSGATIDARERLRIESAVRKTAGELDALTVVADLVCTAAAPRTTALDLGDVLATEPSARARGAGLAVLEVELRAHPALVGDARLVVKLLELAAGIVLRAGVATPRIVVTGDERRISIEIGAAPVAEAPMVKRPSSKPPRASSKPPHARDDRRVLEVPARPDLPGAFTVVRAAVAKNGVGVVASHDGRRVAITL